MRRSTRRSTRKYGMRLFRRKKSAVPDYVPQISGPQRNWMLGAGANNIGDLYDLQNAGIRRQAKSFVPPPRVPPPPVPSGFGILKLPSFRRKKQQRTPVISGPMGNPNLGLGSFKIEKHEHHGYVEKARNRHKYSSRKLRRTRRK